MHHVDPSVFQPSRLLDVQRADLLGRPDQRRDLARSDRLTGTSLSIRKGARGIDIRRAITMTSGMTDPVLHPTWREALRGEFDSDYMAALHDFLLVEEQDGKRIFPPAPDRYRALDLTPLDRVRVVILGQDPYHGAGQAHGLSFSVRPDTRIPPSLVNIYKEMEADLGLPRARHGFLEHWAEQGVLLLNAVLTVEMGRAASHQSRGWERFTDAVIRAVDARNRPVVFMLWGSHAQHKAAFVDSARHLVLRSPHPSPLSAHGGFFGSKPFSRANAFLMAHGEAPIDWALPPL